MMKKISISILTLTVTVAALLMFTLTVDAQPRPHRLGVVIRIDTPDDFFMTRADIATEVLRDVRSSIDDARGISVVDQDVLVSAQEQLGITLGIDSENRELNVVSNLLNLDRLVVIHIDVSNRFNVEIISVIYNNNAERTANLNANATGPLFEGVLQRATNEFLEELIDILN